MARSHRVTLLVLAAFLLCGILGTARAAEGENTGTEKEIRKKDLPAAVLAAFERSYPNAKIKDVGMETEDSTAYYEIESKDGKIKRDLLYAADGTLKEIEELMKTDRLPAAVRDTVATEYPTGKIKKAEKITRDGVVSYEVVVRSGGGTYEVALSADGKIIKAEMKNGEEEEREDGEAN